MPPSRLIRLARRATRARVPQLIFAAVALILMARTENFFKAATFGSILSLASIIGVLAIGQTFVLIGGGFDLSQGAALALSAAVGASLAVAGWPPYVAGAGAIGCGLLLGFINGFFVSMVRTNPFVTTLSTLLIFRGAAFALLKGGRLSEIEAFTILDQGPTILGTLVPWRAFLFPILAAAAWLVLRLTLFGQHVYAVGGNPQASRLAGIETRKVTIICYMIGGLAAGIGAIQTLAWLQVAKADLASGYELDSIAACVVGGVSLQGGAGSVVGAALGCLFLRSLATLITMSGFPDDYRTIVTGAVILVFAAADAFSRDPDSR